LAGELILVVDDGRENREFVVEHVLKPNGYQWLVAADGREGFELALQHHPDLILLDLQMPRMNGVKVLQNLAARGVDIPVILMTFHGSEEIAINVFRLGVRDYVKKPYTVDEMLLAIERSLNEVRLRKDKEALTERVIQAGREMQKRLQELTILYGVGKNVTMLMSMNQLLPRVVDAATQITYAEEGYLYLMEEGRLVCRVYRRAGRELPVNADIFDPLVARIAQTGETLVITPDQVNGSSRYTAAAYAPLMLRNEVIGVLGVSNTAKDAPVFTRHDSGLLSALSSYATIAIENARNYRTLQTAREQETSRIRNSFEKLVAPSVVRQVLNQPDALHVGGARQEVSILFVDLRGYTAWSENNSPENVVEMLNDYLSIAAEIILSWNGTLDKFLGDGLMAIFNAPESQPDHMHRAMNYTAVGDVVNLAKRLQEYAAPGQILVDEAVINRLGSLAQSRPLGEIKIRGHQKRAFAYELFGLEPTS
jgi:class 3 adenylate cyclase/DNA-binding response OmpR family regulator